MSALVSCHGVAKRYLRGTQSVDVLTTVDLQIHAGDFIALMGPSGSGKTTLAEPDRRTGSPDPRQPSKSPGRR